MMPDDSSNSLLITPEEPTSSEEADLIARLKETGIGLWFVTQGDDSGEIKGKLSWISPITTNCIFVGGSGELVDEKPLHMLAKEIIAGRTQMIDPENTPFFTRALLAIQNQLQSASQA